MSNFPWLTVAGAIPLAGTLAVLLLAKARFEERLLLARYPEYAEYRRRTWGVIPGMGRRR